MVNCCRHWLACMGRTLLKPLGCMDNASMPSQDPRLCVGSSGLALTPYLPTPGPRHQVLPLACLSPCMHTLPMKSVYSVWEWSPCWLLCSEIHRCKFIAYHRWLYRFTFISYLGIRANLCSRSLLHRSWQLLLHFLATGDQPDPCMPLMTAQRWSISSWHPNRMHSKTYFTRKSNKRIHCKYNSF